jgi:hypothetical protein
MLATVVQRLEGDQVLMVVENMLLQAQSRLPLQQGQLLFLEVQQQAQGEQPVLRLLQQGPQLPLTELFRNSAPYQQPLEQVLQAMLQRQMNLPEPVRNLVEQLASNSSPQQLTQAQGLQRALENSGVFLESRLAKGDAALQSDIKGLLLRLQAMLQELTATRPEGTTGRGEMLTSQADFRDGSEALAILRQQLPSQAFQGAVPGDGELGQVGTIPQGGMAVRHEALSPQAAPAGPQDHSMPPTGDRHVLQGMVDPVRAGLARIEWQQANALNQGGGSSRGISLELPVLVGGLPQAIPFRLMRDEVPVGEEDKQRGIATEPLWSLAFSVPLGERLGRLDAVVWQRQQSISVTLWAAAEETARLLRQGMPSLQQALHAHGLAVGRIDVFHGQLPMRLDVSATEAPRMVDLLA